MQRYFRCWKIKRQVVHIHSLQDILIHQLSSFRQLSQYQCGSQFSDKFCVKTFAEYIVNSSFTNFAINEPDVIYSALLKIYALGAIFSTLLLLCRESLSNWYSSANFRLHSYEYLKYQTQCTLPDSLISIQAFRANFVSE